MKTARKRADARLGRSGGSTVRRLNLSCANRQATRKVDLRLLRRIVRTLVSDLLQVRYAELGICLVGAPEITRLNEAFLRHAGPTDVIAFNYADGPPPRSSEACLLHGDLFVCVDEAARQARRFRTSWQAELVRYIVHGTLHLLGHDDRVAAARARMKRAENRLLTLLGKQYALRRVAGQSAKRKCPRR